MDIRNGSMDVVGVKHQGVWCRFKSMFGHKHGVNHNEKSVRQVHADLAASAVDLSRALNKAGDHNSESGVRFGDGSRVTHTRTGQFVESVKVPSNPTTPHNRPIVEFSQSAPASLAGSREDLQVSPSKEELQVQANEAYRRRSAPAPDSFSASGSFESAKGWLNFARQSSDDTQRLLGFKNAITYAEYAVILGRKDAIDFLSDVHRSGITGMDGKQLEKDDTLASGVTFWANVKRANKQDFSPARLGLFGGGKPFQNSSEAASVFLHMSNVVHGDHTRNFSGKHVQELVSSFHQMKAGTLKTVPSNIEALYHNRQRAGSI